MKWSARNRRCFIQVNNRETSNTGWRVHIVLVLLQTITLPSKWYLPPHLERQGLRALCLFAQSMYIQYLDYHSVCPLVGIVTLPTPLSTVSVPLPPEWGVGAHSPAGEGLGESQFRRLEKKPSTLPTQWLVSI
jgi:hypothetical protein